MSVATFAAAQLLRALPRAGLSRTVGRLCELRLPRPVARVVVGTYARAYDVNLDEAAPHEGPYPSFDAFFTRALRPGVRATAAEAGALVSPADGRMDSFGPIDAAGALRVKGQRYSVAELVGDAAEGARFHGGQFFVVYLSPRDYHRVHAPVAGAVSTVRSLPGEYYPVNAIGERHVPQLFSRNRRVAVSVDTPRQGRVSVVLVGAIIVGRITVGCVPGRDVPFGEHRIEPPVPVARGDELGVFHLGSTAVVFLEPGAFKPLSRGAGAVLLGDLLAEAP